MTERLVSCRESPTGKHDPMNWIANGRTKCRYCGQEGRVSQTLGTISWNEPDAHLGTNRE